MEPWQRKHIDENRPTLISFTSCNVALFAELRAAGVFSEFDVEQVNAQKTHHGKANTLYNILMARSESYVIIMKGLKATAQSGAYAILAKVPSSVITNLQVSFLGKFHDLEELLQNNRPMEFWLKDISFEELLALNQNPTKTSTVISLIRDTIPPRPFLYYPRNLSRREVVTPDVFSKINVDIFVLKNAKRQQLRKFITSFSIESSTSQLLEWKPKARFITLDLETHWDKLCAKSKNPTHLLRYESATETFILEATSGVSETLYCYLNRRDKSKGGSISEDHFIHDFLDSGAKVVCICDSPGMGKSLLMGSLANKLARKYPNRIVAFIESRRLELTIRNPQAAGTSPLSAVLNYISSGTDLAYQILKEIVRYKNIKFELFFDGVDEVIEDRLDDFIEFVAQLCRDVPNVRVYVASRSFLRYKLEKVTGILSYDIEPINEKTQHSFLTQFWSMNSESSDSERLKQFADFCLNGFKKFAREQASEIIGIPLQCYLLAKIYNDQAIVFADKCQNNLSELPESSLTSLSEMYAEFIMRQLGDTTCNFECMHQINCRESWCNSNCLVKSYHVWQALELVFPRLEEKVSQEIVAFENLTFERILSPGLLKPSQHKIRFEFLHRSFAEYLVAEYCEKRMLTLRAYQSVLPNESLQCSIEQHAFSEIFAPNKQLFSASDLTARSFRENSVAYFLNARIVANRTKLKCTAKVNPNNKLFFYALEACFHYTDAGLFEVYKLATYNFLKEHPEKLKKSLRYQMARSFSDKSITESGKHCEAEYELDSEMELAVLVLRIAIKNSNVRAVKRLCKFFFQSFGIDLLLLSTRSSEVPTPLQIAVERADYDMVFYLLDKTTLDFNALMNACVEFTYYDDAEQLEKRLDIARLVISRYGKCNSEWSGNSNSPLLGNAVHLKAIRFLVEIGANVKVVGDHGRTILYSAAEYMVEQDFYELCHYLFFQCSSRRFFLDLSKCMDYFCNNRYVRTIEIKNIKTKAMLRILRLLIEEVSFTSQPDNSQTTIGGLVEETQELHEIFNSLHQNKTCKKYRDFFLFVFYVAVAEGHVEIADAFLQKHTLAAQKATKIFGVSLVAIAILGGHFRMAKFLISKGANILDAGQKAGLSVLHLAALTKNCELFHKVVELYIEGWNESNKISYLDMCSNSSKPQCTKEIPKFPYIFVYKGLKTNATILQLILVKIDDLTLQTLELFLSCDCIHTPDMPGLKESVVDINAADAYGFTALHSALSHSRSLEIVKILIAWGADWTYINPIFDLNVIYICVYNCLLKHLKYFIELGGDVNYQHLGGYNALTYALSRQHLCFSVTDLREIIKILISAGFNINHTNKSGLTAYDLAVERGLCDTCWSNLITYSTTSTSHDFSFCCELE